MHYLFWSVYNTPKWFKYMGDYKVYTHNDVLKYIYYGITIPLH